MLTVARDFLKKNFAASPYPLPEPDKILVTLDEILANIILHGLPNQPQAIIELALTIDSSQIKIVIRDPGEKFNLAEAPIEDPQENIRQGKHHGFGIYIIKKHMDRIHHTYRKKERKNVLTLIKYIPQDKETKR